MKTAILSGANGNLGRSFLKTLKKEGFFIFAADLDTKGITPSRNVKPVSLDIGDEEEVKAFFRSVKSVDALVNNAGIGVYTPFEKRTKEEFMEVVRVNMWGTFLMVKEAALIMKKKKSGKIVNIGSIYGKMSSDPRIYGKSGRNNSEVYSMTKAGVIMLTRYMSAYLAPYNIQVNCISPGGIFSNQTSDFVSAYEKRVPAGRMATLKDMQSALKFLISSGSEYITGQNITIDGGLSAW